jgi:predicted TIM-barrel fold metal-dependent hydrolase
MKVIDLDSHSRPRTEDYFIEPQYSHLRPRVYVDATGNRREIFNNKVVSVRTHGELTIAAEHGKAEWRAANYDGHIRYKQVSAAGIDFQFVSAGTVGEFSYIDAKVGAAFCRAANNFIHKCFMKPYPKVFTGLPQLPLQDIPEALNELERCVKDLGMRAFLMPTNWNGIDMADPYWWNFWDRARELGIRGIVVHIGSLAGPWVGKDRLGILGPDGTTGRRMISQPFEYCTNIINLIFGGMMDSFPEFRFAFLEAGAEFAIMLKHRMRENLEQISYLADMLTEPLEEYFKRLYFLLDDCLLDENGKRLHYALEEIGDDNLFFGTDYPHADGHLDTCSKIRSLPWLNSQTKDKILGGNVQTLIGGELF